MTVRTPPHFTGTDSEVSRFVRNFTAKNKGKSAFPEAEVKGLLREMGLPVPNGILLGGGENAPEGLGLKFPLVAKVSSLKITSKSNVGGVRTGITNTDELNGAIGELSRIPGAKGVLIEEMAPEGIEVVIGGVVDSQFGPIVMFGLGGVFVELFKDVAFGLAPLGPEEALRLLRQTKGYRILEGYRGKPAVDKNALIRLLVVVSHIMATGLIREIDLNPVALYPEGSMILDAKMLLIS
jgi:hypothetical protein